MTVDENAGEQGSLRDLYRGPLDEFVARRTRLVRATRPADRSAAAAFGKARKPPVAVWAIDQVAIDGQDVVAALLAAAADASDAQRSVSDQSETREGLLLASGRLRDAVEMAARAADAVLEKAGHASGEDANRRIRATLHAAATGSSDDRMALWQGTLDHEVAPPGFGAVDTANEDAPELTAVLAPLRRVTPHRKPSSRGRAPESDELAAREAAERAAEKLSAAAKRARDLATAKRLHANALADETRAAEREAAAAEQAADAAEDAAKAARPALGT